MSREAVVVGSGAAGSAAAWELARDRGFDEVVARGRRTASARHDHTVHVDVRGRPAWDTAMAQYEVVERIDDHTDIVYSVTKEQGRGIVRLF